MTAPCEAPTSSSVTFRQRLELLRARLSGTLRQGPRNEALVDSFYRDSVGRNPSGAERAEALRRLVQGITFDGLLADLSSSQEGVEHSIRLGNVAARAKLARNADSAMDLTKQERLVFLHIMKTGGISLSDLACRHVEAEQSMVGVHLDEVLLTPRPLLAGLRLITGHIPFEGLTVIPGAFTTTCVLRDPRDRTLSHFNELREAHPRYAQLTLETFLYDDEYDIPSGNYQARQLAHQIDVTGAWVSYSLQSLHQARGGSQSEPYPLQALFDSTPMSLDEDDLHHAAVAHLAAIDIVGVTDQLDTLGAVIDRFFGGDRRPIRRLNVSERPVSPDVRARYLRRIDERTAIDRDLYDLATRRQSELTT